MADSVSISVALEVLPHGEGLPLPAYQTAGAAGADLVAAITEPLELSPGTRHAVPTGIRLALPDGYEAQVRPRSGLALRHGITVVNAPGTVDADYRGEILVPLVNLSDVPYCIERGERIAQMVIAPVTRAVWSVVDDVGDNTVRGTSRFGSTGR
ncbi:MAG: dUTP diphosphatase [Myxococcota bacterium]